MFNLTPLITFLKIVSLVGLIITVCMMTAVIYQKLKFYYPERAEKSKFIFVFVAILMSAVMTFLFFEFLGTKDKAGVLLQR